MLIRAKISHLMRQWWMLKQWWLWSKTICTGSSSDRCSRKKMWKSWKASSSAYKCRRLATLRQSKESMDLLTKRLYGESTNMSRKDSKHRTWSHLSRSRLLATTSSESRSLAPTAPRPLTCAQVASKAQSSPSHTIATRKLESQNFQITRSVLQRYRKASLRMNRR